MTMQERAISLLNKNGCQCKAQSEHITTFSYMGVEMLLLQTDDAAAIHLMCSAQMLIDDERPLPGYEFINEVNLTVRYAKIMVIETMVWIAIERRVAADEDLDRVLFELLTASRLAYDMLQDEGPRTFITL